MKVGELARRAGLTVRTLHHYDEIGLLQPSQHTASGHRLYTAADVARLQQIVSLRQLGLSLDEVRNCLHRADFAPLQVIELHLERLRQQLAAQQQLCRRLEALAARLGAAGEVTTEEFLHVIEGMSMVEKYYTPEQLEYLHQRREQVGAERIRAVEQEWPQLLAEVQSEMDQGTDPASERMQELARRWMGLVNEFTGGNPGIEQSLGKMYQQETTIHGMDVAGMRPLMEYVNRALAAKPV